LAIERLPIGMTIDRGPRTVSLLAVSLAALAIGGDALTQVRPPVSGYRVVNTYPHDPQANTQGLIFRDGFLYESTGLRGRSTVRKVQLETGQVVQQAPVDARYFAEGLADWGGRLIQLTWQSNIGFVYDLESFRLQTIFRYSGEGDLRGARAPGRPRRRLFGEAAERARIRSW
jgi:glutaminyl-peptide cyclotransferase